MSALLSLLLAAAPAAQAAPQQCQIEETSPRRTIVNGYQRYVGEEVGSPGSVTRFGSLAIRIVDTGMTEGARLLNQAGARRGSDAQITEEIKFQVKAPGMAEGTVVNREIYLYAGKDSSSVAKVWPCGQEVSISLLQRDGLNYWVISSF